MELTNTKTDLCQIKCKLRDSEKEVKQQLQQYVNEVKKVEELLSQKDKENEKMLEHYRSLSNYAVLLEGNNQSLEIEAAENRQQLEEAEQEIRNLRNEIAIIKTETIEKLESQVESLSTQIYSLENDLDAVNELCRKLYLQQDKLNNELSELQNIRQNIRSKLEKENETLRAELNLGNYNSSADACALSPIHTTTTTTTRTQAATAEKAKEKIDVDSLKELLSANRHELVMHRSIAERATKEMKQLRQKVDELQKKLHEEHDKANLYEKLTNEFSIQIQELQNELTDERNNNSKTISPTGNSNNDISISNSPDRYSDD